MLPKRAMKFSWNDAARKSLEAYEETLKNKPWLEK
jgi:hypothetical protein